MNELLNNLFESILQFITTHFPQTSKNVHFFKLLKTLLGIQTIRDGKGMKILFDIRLSGMRLPDGHCLYTAPCRIRTK